MEAQEVTLAEPIRTALSWWLLAEIARRHPGTVIHETHPMDGFYDCLELHRHFRPPPEAKALIAANRNGGIHFHDSGADRRPFEDLVRLDPQDAIRTMEKHAGLPSPAGPAPATPRTLTYRVAAEVVMATARRRAPLDVRAVGWDAAVFAQNDVAADWARRAAAGTAPGDLWGRLWGVGDGAAVLHVDGYVVTRSEVVHLPTAYARNGRRLHRTVSAVLGDLL